MDTKAIERHVLGILEAIGEDPNREGLRETPQRVAKMLEEVLEGVAYSNHDIAKMFGKTFTNECAYDSDNAVVMKDITVFSYCEHHMALMYDMKVNVAYIPRGKVLGLSKIARICDGATRTGYRRNHCGSRRYARRGSVNQRMSQLHDRKRNQKRLVQNRDNYIQGRIQEQS